MSALVSFDTMLWLKEPHVSRHERLRVVLVTHHQTNFCRQIFYGFEHYFGHAPGYEIDVGFTLQVAVQEHFDMLYDQVS